MAEQAPEHQDRGLFGLFGKKKEETEGKHDDDPATHTHNEAQSEAASYYPAAPHAGGEHCHEGHGHEGQLTPEVAEQQKHSTGLLGKLHRNHSSSSSSSSDEEEEEGKKKKKKEGGRKKKGSKEKSKGQHSSDQCAGEEEEKKTGLVDKIKEKLPGHHKKKDGEDVEKKQQL